MQQQQCLMSRNDRRQTSKPCQRHHKVNRYHIAEGWNLSKATTAPKGSSNPKDGNPRWMLEKAPRRNDIGMTEKWQDAILVVQYQEIPESTKAWASLLTKTHISKYPKSKLATCFTNKFLIFTVINSLAESSLPLKDQRRVLVSTPKYLSSQKEGRQTKTNFKPHTTWHSKNRILALKSTEIHYSTCTVRTIGSPHRFIIITVPSRSD